IDISIWSFWYSILFKTDDFIELIKSTEITIDEWHQQKYIQNIKNEVDTLTLGFSTFFLNRTNRSGIIQKAGVIGGLEQKSKYPLDCRFNKKSLISKIEKISQYREFIHLYNMDAVNFIEEIEKKIEERFFCIDPPYFKKGQSLYTNFYTPNDHEKLSKVIKKIEGQWILTYDNIIEIKNLYSNLPQYNFDLNYTAAEKRKGTELLITCPNFIVSDSLNLSKIV
ncbi:DNA adenine methylase, partial [Acinetobacter baumannii]|nr:DNA adenine methylase [Acinetobacter baumannii]